MYDFGLFLLRLFVTFSSRQPVEVMEKVTGGCPPD